ncbi:MAG: hypothetical protein AAGJ79_08560 [Verrucomicrobiota bacterium]
MQPVVREESKRESQRRLGWEDHADGTGNPKAREGGHTRAILGMVGALALLGVAVVAFSNSMSPPQEAPIVEVQEKDLFSDFLPYEEVKKGISDVVTEFLTARSVEEIRGLVVREKHIWPSLANYYRSNAKEYHSVDRVQLALKYETPEGDPEFYLAKAHLAGGKVIPLGVEISDDGILVDWESHTGFNPVAVEALRNGKENAESFRVVFRKALFFDDDSLMESVAGEKGVVLEADLASREDPVFIFVGGSVKEFEKIRKLSEDKKDHPAMFRLYKDAVLPSDYLIAESFLQFGWVDRESGSDGDGEGTLESVEGLSGDPS